MSLNAVQLYTQGLLTGNNAVNAPFYNVPVEVHIAPPVAGDDSNPQLYIWGARFNAARQTAPRGAGFKKSKYDMMLWLMVVQDNDWNVSDQAFPVLVDSVISPLEAAAIPVPVTDPETGEVSQLLTIAESYSVDYRPVQATANEAVVLYQADITIAIEEARQR